MYKYINVYRKIHAHCSAHMRVYCPFTDRSTIDIYTILVILPRMVFYKSILVKCSVQYTSNNKKNQHNWMKHKMLKEKYEQVDK